MNVNRFSKQVGGKSHCNNLIRYVATNYLMDGLTCSNFSKEDANSDPFTGLNIFFCDGGYFARYLFGNIGLGSNPPVQLGHTLCNTSLTHVLQKVHSKAQIMASSLAGDKCVLQFSQFVLISIISHVII